jgi:hypothetical protein
MPKMIVPSRYSGYIGFAHTGQRYLSGLIVGGETLAECQAALQNGLDYYQIDPIGSDDNVVYECYIEELCGVCGGSGKVRGSKRLVYSQKECPQCKGKPPVKIETWIDRPFYKP